VDGEQLYTRTTYAEKRGEAWYIPLLPIADAVGAVVTFHPPTLSIGITQARDGSVAFYDGTTGAVTKDFVARATLEPGLPSGTGEADLRVPATLLAELLDVRVRVSDLDNEVAIFTSPADLEVAALELPSVDMEEVRYNGFATSTSASTTGGLELSNRTRIRQGVLSSRARARASEAGPVSLRAFTVSYANDRGDEWAVGDLQGDRALPWLSAFGRGAQLVEQREDAGRRLSLGYVQLATGYADATSTAYGPTFGEHVGMASHTWGHHAGVTDERSVTLAGAWLGGTADQPEGLLFSTQHELRSGYTAARATAGAFWTPGSSMARRSAFDLDVEWVLPPGLGLSIGAGRYDVDFRLPAQSFADDASSFVTLGSRASLSRWLSLSAHHARRRRIEDGRRDRSTSATASFYPSIETVQTANVSWSRSDSDSSRSQSAMTFDVRGRVPIGRWFASSRTALRSDSPLFSTLGLTFGSSIGLTQLAGSWSDTRLTTISGTWSPPVQLAPQTALSLGARWIREREEDADDLFVNLQVGYNVTGHQADIAVNEEEADVVTRFHCQGQFLIGRNEEAKRRFAPAMSSSLGRIEGRIFVDENLNGDFDEADRALRGIDVLLDGGGVRARTDVAGKYVFDYVTPGQHKVAVSARTLRADLSMIDPLERRIGVPTHSTVVLEHRACVNRRITGLVYFDANENGARDPEEGGLPDVLVVLAGGGDTLTGPDGRFQLGDVPPGEHALYLGASTLGASSIVPMPTAVIVPGYNDVADVAIPVGPRQREIIRKTF